MKTANNPKQITLTKMRFQKMLLSTPNGLQYSAKRNTIAVTEMIILTRFTRFSFNFSRSFNTPVIPEPIKIIPNQ